jgi:hypothetical protein
MFHNVMDNIHGAIGFYWYKHFIITVPANIADEKSGVYYWLMNV